MGDSKKIMKILFLCPV